MTRGNVLIALLCGGDKSTQDADIKQVKALADYWKDRAMEDVTFARYDTADHLEAEGDIAAYLEVVMEEAGDNPAYIARALGAVARARNMTALADEIGMSRVGLNKALSGEWNPTLATVMKVTKALELKISIQPAA